MNYSRSHSWSVVKLGSGTQGVWLQAVLLSNLTLCRDLLFLDVVYLDLNLVVERDEDSHSLCAGAQSSDPGNLT